jgi:hypothetical protein
MREAHVRAEDDRLTVDPGRVLQVDGMRDTFHLGLDLQERAGVSEQLHRSSEGNGTRVATVLRKALLSPGSRDLRRKKALSRDSCNSRRHEEPESSRECRRWRNVRLGELNLRVKQVHGQLLTRPACERKRNRDAHGDLLVSS